MVARHREICEVCGYPASGDFFSFKENEKALNNHFWHIVKESDVLVDRIFSKKPQRTLLIDGIFK